MGAPRTRSVEEHAGIVPRCDVIGASLEGLAREDSELHLLVAHDVRVGRETARVAIDQVVDHVTLVLLLVIPDLEVDTQLHGHALGIGKVLGPGALEPRQIDRPVAHVHARDVKATFDEQRRGKRGIHSPAHADDNLCCHARLLSLRLSTGTKIPRMPFRAGQNERGKTAPATFV